MKIYILCANWRWLNPSALIIKINSCMVIQESLGFRIPRCRFKIPCLWIPDSTSMDSGFHNQQPGFWITIMVGFRIPFSGFRIRKTKITWIPDYLTWGESRSKHYCKMRGDHWFQNITQCTSAWNLNLALTLSTFCFVYVGSCDFTFVLPTDIV